MSGAKNSLRPAVRRAAAPDSGRRGRGRYRAAVFFVIQMEGASYFCPNDDTHPAFGAALREAAAAGVGVFAYDCLVAPERMEIHSPVEVRL